MAGIRCCKDCEDRHLLCWNDCEKYKAAKAEFEKAKENERREKAVIGFVVDGAIRESRRKHKNH